MKKNKGFSFVEVMVCVVILSTGLLGLMGLQARGLKNNISANQRTQATLLAYNMIDNIRANVSEATKGAASLYVTTVVSNSTTPDTNCQPTATTGTPATTCTSTNMAVSNLVEWNRVLTQQYCGGNGTTNIVCNGASLGEISYAAPVFTITISWDDNRNGIIDNRDPMDATKSCYTKNTVLPAVPTDPKTPPYDPCFRTTFQL